MEAKKKEERIETEEKKNELCLEMESAMVALGVVVLVAAGAKHALASLFEQWRAMVFLFLNLLLLAILFTSIRSNSNIDDDHNSSSELTKIKSHEIMNSKKKMKKKIMIKSPTSCSSSTANKNKSTTVSTKRMSTSSSSVQIIDDYLSHHQNHEEISSSRINVEKEEDINARVEAFIARFRQQLAMDIAKGRKSSAVSFASSSKEGSSGRRASFAL